MKKIKFLFIYIILLVVINLPVVFAIESWGGSSTGGTTGGQGSSASNRWTSPYVVGIRVSIVTKNGTKLASHNYIRTSDYNSVGSREVYYISSECSKVSYFNDFINCISPSNKSNWSVELLNSAALNITDLATTIDEANFSSVGIDLNGNTETSWNLSNFLNALANQGTDSAEYKSNIKIFLDAFSGNPNFSSTYFNGKNELYILYEPMTVVTIGNEPYFGTDYELSKLAKNSPGSGVTYSSGGTCAISGSTGALCDLNLPLRGTLPKSTYMTSTQASSLAAIQAKYYGKTLNSTTSTKFFANLSTPLTVISDAASTSRFTASEVTESYAIAIGIAWLGDGGGITCSSVDNNSTLKTNIETDYNNGTSLNDLYNKYKITYTQDGKTQNGDTKWFVNECTCAGLDTIFDTIYTAAWNNRYSSAIESIKTTLGTDWYDRLNIVKFNQLTPGQINYVLNTYSSNYNTTMSNYISSLSASSGESYSWTPISYSKYKSLNCGVGTSKSDCTTVANWYNTNKPESYVTLPTTLNSYNRLSTYDKRNLVSQASTMFNAYNVIVSKTDGVWWSWNSTSGGVSSYYAKCLTGTGTTTPVTGSVDCTPRFNVGTCLSRNQITYSDSNDWNNCIYNDYGYYTINTHKTSANSGLSYQDTTLGSESIGGGTGSDYCDVYCTENLVTNFNSNTITVQAGYHFIWDNQKVSGSRTCKTKSINWSQYISDVDEANDATRQAYVDWQLERLKPAAINNASSSSDDGECCISGHEEEDEWEDSKGNTHTSHYFVCDVSGTRYTTETISFSLPEGENNSWDATWCNSNRPSVDIAGREETYNSSISYARGLTNKMASCSVWDANNVYTINPTATVTYSGNTYSYSGTMITSTSYNLNISNDCGTITAPNITTCSGRSCIKTSSVNKCTYNSETRTGNASFSYPEGIFEYVLKSNNLSFHSSNLSTYSNQNYIDIGYSNFPVAYKTPDGVYGYNSGKGGELSLTYSHLGHMKNGSTALDSILSSSDVDYNGDYTKWQCQYTVSSNLVCDEKNNNCVTKSEESGGIDLIYRAIDLNYPFPDITGKGRNTGSNWCDSGSDCSNNNAIVKKYITNNRGVEADKVYDQEPMYSFTLTSAIIQEIRKYNDNNSYTDYTGELGGQSYGYKCNTGTGIACISDYLTHLIEIAGTKNNSGVCSKDTTRTYNNTTAFYNCGY